MSAKTQNEMTSVEWLICKPTLMTSAPAQFQRESTGHGLGRKLGMR